MSETPDKSSPRRTLLNRWLGQRHFYLGVGIPMFFVFIMIIGGFQCIAIALDEARTMATVTGLGSHGVLLYRYEVDDRDYSGSGDPGNPPYPVGSTFEIRYCKAHPSFSVAHNPFTIFGQFMVGSLFLLWADFMATRSRKRKENKASQAFIR